MEMVVEFVNLVMNLSGFLGQLNSYCIPWNNIKHCENRKICWNKDKGKNISFNLLKRISFTKLVPDFNNTIGQYS